ncbi:hypothetical protein TNCV_4420721 [Trichonephila clavipes]|nr:hypothetical protein TNCV_4420721 [Trichonephila clavipes]
MRLGTPQDSEKQNPALKPGFMVLVTILSDTRATLVVLIDTLTTPFYTTYHDEAPRLKELCFLLRNHKQTFEQDYFLVVQGTHFHC